MVKCKVTPEPMGITRISAHAQQSSGRPDSCNAYSWGHYILCTFIFILKILVIPNWQRPKKVTMGFTNRQLPAEVCFLCKVRCSPGTLEKNTLTTRPFISTSTHVPVHNEYAWNIQCTDNEWLPQIVMYLFIRRCYHLYSFVPIALVGTT